MQSITLPDASASVADRAGAGLRIFALGTRDTTSGTVEANGRTVATTAPNTSTGGWASDTEGPYNFEGGTNVRNQSFRLLVQPSVTGSVIRVKLDNALGTSAPRNWCRCSTVSPWRGPAVRAGPVSGWII